MAVRTVDRVYADPIEIIWMETAARLGFRVQRSRASYASYDGAGTITLGDAIDLDADDHVGQMLLHEFCHALVMGPEALSRVDWGLSVEGLDALEEHATHRVQAALAEQVGLRAFFAVTTDWRPYYDALPADPLAPGDDPAIPLAVAAYARARQAPWAQPLREALEATAHIVRVVRGFAAGPSLYWA